MLILLIILLLGLGPSHCTTSSKRGLIYISNTKAPNDDSIWTRPGSDLTWYYNYGESPVSSVANTLAFVPMLWGQPTTSGSFYNTVKSLNDKGMNITHVLGFNEPDGDKSTGGSSIAADKAASLWMSEIEPLSNLGIKLGAPAVTGSPQGTAWLKSFYSACNGKCTTDFIPVHWYGVFEGLASHVGEVYATFGNKTIWVTEFADPNVALLDTQSMYNSSFGSFRSSASNVGVNVAMLNRAGQLTDIGSWYLGGDATGIVPQSTATIISSSVIRLLFVVGLCLWVMF